MANLHAEGYSGGALKHGPFALIDDENVGKFGATPIIMIILDDQHAHHMRTACEEVGEALGAHGLIDWRCIVFMDDVMFEISYAFGFFLIGQGAWS